MIALLAERRACGLSHGDASASLMKLGPISTPHDRGECHRLLQWYRDGIEIDHAISSLSTYMGHVKVTDNRPLQTRVKYGRTIHVAGAGSFGVWVEGRPPSTPQLYNLIEVDRDLRSIKIHTRYKDNEEGAWSGRAIWPGRSKHTKRTFCTVRLSRSTR
jgi:hypothetical protein